jgi:hypothetical protein
MFTKYVLIILCFSVIISTAIKWTNEAWLDPDRIYLLQWRIDEKSETITFQAIVKTLGWIGFGLSPNGGMPGSDIVIGWVNDNDGTTYFHV